MSALIEIAHIGKTYPHQLFEKKRAALTDVSLTIHRGQSFGLLGPNGAGKTTLMKILLGLTRATTGTVRINGKLPTDATCRAEVGYLPEQVTPYSYLTGEEFLDLAGRLYGMPAAKRAKSISEILHRVHMEDARSRRLRTYSKGMLQRIGLAQALLHTPKLLFLDEPLDGLDPIGRHDMKTILNALRETGITIVLNSHILSDVEQLCDSIGILNQGKLLVHGTTKSLLAHGTDLEQFFIKTLTQKHE